MLRPILCLTALLLALHIPLWTAELETVADDDATLVGEWARPSQWIITGSQAVPEARLRAALLSSTPVLAATHARAPRGELVRQVREGLHAAYRSYGHVTATVRVGSRDGRLAIAIVEGTGCTAGPVDVVGMTIAPPAGLIAVLADAQVDHESLQPWTKCDVPMGFIPPLMRPERKRTALWSLGVRPDASERNLRRLADAVTSFYERHGRMAVRCAVTVQEDAGRARLRISIVDEGRPAVLARLSWLDLRPELIPRVEADFGLRPGMPCTYATLQACLDRLHASGRFFPPLVRAEETAEGYALTIATRELASLPPYPEPLSPEAEVLLRTNRWIIDNFVHSDAEMVLRLDRDGLIVELALSRSAAACRFALGGKDLLRGWSDGDRWTIIDAANRRRYETSGLHPFMSFAAFSRLPDQPDGSEHAMTMQVGATSDQRMGDLLRVERCCPSVFAALAYRKDEQKRVVRKDLIIRDGTLLLGESAGIPSIALDLATGRPLPSPQLTFVSGAVARLRAELERTSPAADAALPLDPGSCAELWLDLIQDIAINLEQPLDAETATTLARTRLLLRHVLAPASRWLLGTLAGPADDRCDDFTIPHPAADQRAPGNLYADLADRFLAPPALALQERLPVGSWPPILLRSAQAVLGGRMPLVNQDLEATVRRPDFGPVGALVSAAILDRFSPREAAQFAAFGLQQIADEARFRAELALLRPFATEITTWAAEPGRSDLLELFAERRPAVEAALRSAVAEARRSGTDPAATIEAAALAMWRAGVRDWVGDRLFDVVTGRMPQFALPRM